MGKEEANAEETEAKGGSPVMMIVLAAVVALGLGAGGAFFFLKSQPAPAAEDPAAIAAAEAAAAKQREAEGEGFKERLYSLDPFVVNVTGDGYSRFLKVKIELEADSPDLKTELDARLSQVRDALIVLLSSKQLVDITDFEGKSLLKEDVLERVNDVLVTGSVKSVLFTEFVVQ